MKRSSFQKGTLNVFLRRDAEPEIQVLRYRPVGNSWIVTHLIVWDVFSRRECLDVCYRLRCECIESLQEQFVRSGRFIQLKAVHKGKERVRVARGNFAQGIADDACGHGHKELLYLWVGPVLKLAKLDHPLLS